MQSVPTRNPKISSRGFDKLFLITHNIFGTRAPRGSYLCEGIMNNVMKWWTFVLVPESVLGGIAFAIMAPLNDTVALMSALYVAGAVATVLIVFAMVRGDEVGVTIAAVSLSIVLAVFCSISGALVFTIALALVGGALIFITDRIVKKG